MTIAVVGLGKIGLPLAAQIASTGQRVIGADRDPEVVGSVNRGIPPFPGEAGLEERMRTARYDGTLEAVVSTEDAVEAATTVMVAVPLLVDTEKRPIFDNLENATAAIGAAVRPNTLVAYETTLPVGTTRRFADELARRGGLSLGVDLFVCHSPERVSSGRVFADLRRYPKLIGGVDVPSADRAVTFYESILQFDDRPDLDRPSGVWDLGSAEAAEMTKLMEVVYRDVNIALANEFAAAAQSRGLDVTGLIEAANSQPFSNIHTPGIAVGGHCVPVYSHLYVAGDTNARLPAIAREVNDAMPAYGAALLAEALGGLDGRHVAVLGLAYRGGVKEDALSGTAPLVAELERLGASVEVHDPLYSSEEIRAAGFEPFDLGNPCDGAVIQTDHPEYAKLRRGDLSGVEAVLDGRRITDPADWSGVTWRAIGGESPHTTS